MSDRPGSSFRVRTSEDKVCRKDWCWSVRAVYVLESCQIFGFLHIAVTTFGFFISFSGVFVVVEELFVLELMAYNSDLRLCTENQ